MFVCMLALSSAHQDGETAIVREMVGDTGVQRRLGKGNLNGVAGFRDHSLKYMQQRTCAKHKA